MQLGALTRAGYRALLIRLQGSGLANEEGTKRYTELDAIASIADKCTQAVEEVTAGLFMSSALATLDLYERVRYLVQGSSVSDATRQARLVAFSQGASKLVASRLANAFSTYLGGAGGPTLTTEAATLTAHAASPLGAFVVGRREALADTGLKRSDLGPVLERGLPARAESAGVSTADAVWGAALEPASIAVSPLFTVPSQTKARVAPIELPPGAMLTREQWIELQSMLVPKSHGFSIDAHKQGRIVFLRFTLAPGASVSDSSIDYSNRLVTVAGVISENPVSDPAQRAAGEHIRPSPAKSGYTQMLLNYNGFDWGNGPGVLGVTVSPSGTTITFTNVTGAMPNTQTLNLALMVMTSPTFLPNTTTDTQPWLSASSVLRADLAELYQAQLVSSQSTPGSFVGVAAGALRRALYTGPLYYLSGFGVPQFVVLDSSEDWRNRWVLVSACYIASGDGVTPNDAFPVPSCDGMYEDEGAPWRLFYTGPGVAPGTTTQQPYQHPVGYPGVGFKKTLWLFADTSGALCAEMKAISTDRRALSCLALVIASERDNAASVVTTVPVHATQVQTIDLEQPQRCGCYAQGQQGGVPRYLLSDLPGRAVPTCPPLGLVTEGHSPSRPVSWRVHERLGALDNATYEVRQKLTGQRRRVVSIFVPAGSTTPLDSFNLLAESAPGLNDQVDFRDRYLLVAGRFDAADIRLGAAAQLSDATATPFTWALYTGPYELAQHTKVIGTDLSLRFEFARAGAGRGMHSRLVAINASAAAVYLTCTVEASGKLGLCDSRLYGYVP
jgi:hypothetical protein